LKRKDYLVRSDWDYRRENVMDWAITLLILEGIPLLALICFLRHKKEMYLLEKGISVPDRSGLRAERRMLNGIFLSLAGISMILIPKGSHFLGLEVKLSFELLAAGVIVLCAGLSLIYGHKFTEEDNEDSSGSKNSLKFR
jgi:hypothetical protein